MSNQEFKDYYDSLLRTDEAVVNNEQLRFYRSEWDKEYVNYLTAIKEKGKESFEAYLAVRNLLELNEQISEVKEEVIRVLKEQVNYNDNCQFYNPDNI